MKSIKENRKNNHYKNLGKNIINMIELNGPSYKDPFMIE
jgi:hypothetical protein